MKLEKLKAFDVVAMVLDPEWLVCCAYRSVGTTPRLRSDPASAHQTQLTYGA